MLIHVTDRSDDTTLLLNPDLILLIRPAAQGGSTIYLASGSLHHPDILVVRESVEDLSRLFRKADAMAGSLHVPAEPRDAREDAQLPH
jgi:hypothetical protein